MNGNTTSEIYRLYSREGWGWIFLLGGGGVIFLADVRTKWDLKISLALVCILIRLGVKAIQMAFNLEGSLATPIFGYMYYTWL